MVRTVVFAFVLYSLYLRLCFADQASLSVESRENKIEGEWTRNSGVRIGSDCQSMETKNSVFSIGLDCPSEGMTPNSVSLSDVKHADELSHIPNGNLQSTVRLGSDFPSFTVILT